MKTYQTAEVEGALAGAPYFPMLLFPGATLPYERMPAAPQRLADILPLTQGIKLLKAASLNTPAGSALVPLAVMLVIAAVCTCLSLNFSGAGHRKAICRRRASDRACGVFPEIKECFCPPAQTESQTFRQK